MLGLRLVGYPVFYFFFEVTVSLAWPPGIVRSLKGLPTLKSVEASREESEVSNVFIHSINFLFFLFFRQLYLMSWNKSSNLRIRSLGILMC